MSNIVMTLLQKFLNFDKFESVNRRSVLNLI